VKQNYYDRQINSQKTNMHMRPHLIKSHVTPESNRKDIPASDRQNLFWRFRIAEQEAFT
jgi:hypothetical protein